MRHAACLLVLLSGTDALYRTRRLLAPANQSSELCAMTDFVLNRLETKGHQHSAGPCPHDAAEFMRLVGALRRNASATPATALARVRAGHGAIFFKHMRKAAGTSVAHFLQTVVNFKHREANRGAKQDGARVEPRGAAVEPMPLTLQEWGVFPVACLAHSPRALFVTCLREPVRRHISEYWYAGPG